MTNKIIGVGETILDIIFHDDIPQAAVPGGSTFNAIISLGRCKVPCSIVTEVGADHVGDIIFRYLQANNVDTSYVTRRQDTRSHVSLAFLDADNNAQYQFYKDHANVAISDNMPVISQGDIMLFGSFFAVNPVIRQQVFTVLQDGKAKEAILYYDINFRASHIKDIPMIMDNIRENMKISTIVRGSLEDFTYLYGSDDVDEIYEKHIKPYCPCFICTDGGKPIQLRTPVLSTSFATAPVKTVSTIGAGDNFNAGFAFATLHHGGITPKDFSTLSKEKWQPLIEMGQRFSANVCASINNSIDEAFATLLSDTINKTTKRSND